MALTETKIKNAKPKEKMYRLADGQGLYLQVSKKGAKYWRFRYLFAGTEKMLALGVYPDVSLAQAREKRTEARKSVAEGIDPSAKKKEKKRLAKFKAGNSFEVVAKDWFDTNEEKWSPDHAKKVWRRLELHILPEIGSRPISEVAALEILDAIRKVEAKGSTELSRRLLQTCNAIFRFAIITKRAQYNPAADLRGALKPHIARHYPTISDKEIPELLSKLKAVSTSRQNKLAIRMLLLTFVRTGELRRAKWADIDLNRKEWRLPAETTKTKRADHIVPLSRQTIALLEELRPLTGGRKLLFPPQLRCKHDLMSENTITSVLKKMGYKGKLVGHGFRALASTTLNEMGYQPDVIERQLGHVETNEVRKAYNHAQYLPQRRKMMQGWADHIDSLVKGEKSSTNVTAFRRPAA